MANLRPKTTFLSAHLATAFARLLDSHTYSSLISIKELTDPQKPDFLQTNSSYSQCFYYTPLRALDQ